MVLLLILGVLAQLWYAILFCRVCLVVVCLGGDQDESARTRNAVVVVSLERSK